MLRPYQQEAFDAVFRELETVRSTAIIHATGLGKTVLAAMIIKRLSPKRVLFIAHRRELISQAQDTLRDVAGIDSDVEMADQRAESGLFGRKQVVISSVQTQFHRKFCATDFDYLFLDELHHYVGAPHFKEVVDYYLNGNPNLKVIGLTATPNRTDGQALGQIIETVAHTYEIIPAVRDAWLVNIDPKMIEVEGLDYSSISVCAGELNGRQLSEILDEERIVQGMIQPTMELAWGCPPQTLKNHPISEWKQILDSYGDPLRTLIFCCDVNQAQMFSDILNRVSDGISEMVCGDVKRCSHEQRERTGKKFLSGQIKFVSNVDIYSEGYNNPFVQIIVMARPLRSLLKYTQCLGRGTRTWPGVIDDLVSPEQRHAAIASSPKPSLKVIDFVGNCGNHKIVNSIDALGGDMEPNVIERAQADARNGSAGKLVTELLVDAEQQIAEEEKREQRRKLEEARKRKLVLKSTYSVSSVNPFDVLGIQPARQRSWDFGKKLTEPQAAMLRKNNIDPAEFPYHQQKQLLNELFKRIRENRPSFKQSGWLRKHGYDPSEFTFHSTSELMSRWKANGWRRPSESEVPAENIPF